MSPPSTTRLAASTASLMAQVCKMIRLRFVETRALTRLTLPQLNTLTFLSAQPRRTGEVARHLRITVGSASSLVTRLAQKRLVRRQRDPSNRRVVLCELTKRGRDEVERFWAMELRAQDLRNLLSEKELRAVSDGMKILARALLPGER